MSYISRRKTTSRQSHIRRWIIKVVATKYCCCQEILLVFTKGKHLVYLAREMACKLPYHVGEETWGPHECTHWCKWRWILKVETLENMEICYTTWYIIHVPISKTAFYMFWKCFSRGCHFQSHGTFWHQEV